MNILHTVEYYSPSVGGAQEVVRQISERLAERGHEVTVATSRIPGRQRPSAKGVTIEEFDIRGSEVRGFTGDTTAYQDFLRGGPFDVMLNYAAQQWATDLAFPLLRELPYGKVLAPCGFSGLELDEYSGYFERLPEALALYDRIALHSRAYRDAEFIEARTTVPTELLTNGAGADEFEHVAPGGFRSRHEIDRTVPVLLAVGTHSGMKGHSLILDAFRRARIGSAVLVLVGNTGAHTGCLPECRRLARRIRLQSLGRKRVLLLDPPRSEVLEAYAAADLFLLGSRIECSPLVLFEAAASATAFLTVPAGNSQEIAAWTGGGIVVPASIDERGFVAGDAGDFARAIEALLEDDVRREALGAAGRQAWRQQFRWEDIAGRYESVYERVVAERRHAPTGTTS